MLTISDVSNLVKLETEYNTAVEHRTAAREAVNSADFRFRAMREVYEHANNLQNALEKIGFMNTKSRMPRFMKRLLTCTRRPKVCIAMLKQLITMRTRPQRRVFTRSRKPENLQLSVRRKLRQESMKSC
jgi:hypothetical protein